jgi:hypothetical protein
MVLGLAGCSSAPSLFSPGDGSSPQVSIAPTPQNASQVAKLQIAPVIGSPDTVSRELQTQLTSALERNRISVATAAGATGEYIVRGYIVAAREQNGSKISYIWDLTDAAGKRAHRITGEEFAAGSGSDPWSSVTPQIIQRIADKTATQIASSLPGGTSVPVATNRSSAPSGAAPAVASGATSAGSSVSTAANSYATPPPATTSSIATSGPVMAMVPGVVGAPGDGSASLTSAIQRELSSKGLQLANAPGSQTYKVQGKVAMGQGKDGKQPIQIDWTVLDPAGKKLGTVSQKNEVPQGSLDGAWGKTADAAAAAAAQGILKLLPQAKATN